MSRKKRLLINTGLLTLSALAMRVVGMLFQAWLASCIGAEGIGLYQLTGSVTVLFSVFAVSGVRFAATRLVSEEAALGRGNGVLGAVRRCINYALLFSLLSAGILWRVAEPLGFLWVGDARTVLSLRLAAVALPCIAISSVFGGYFTASGRVWKAVLVQLLALVLSVVITVSFLQRCDLHDLEQTCAAITAGSAISELIGTALLLLLYLGERRRWRTQAQQTPHLTRRMLSAALPLALSAYTRTSLNTLEHMLIPKGLRLAGLTAEAALSGYGVVHGMALPAVLFPACLLFSLAELIVPELTQAQTQGRTNAIRRIVRLVRGATAIYALVTAAALYVLAEPIANRFFHTPECAAYIRQLAPLAPIMNLDTVTDGCLRGLGQQGRVMAINILDAALGVVLVLVLLPRFGLAGYVWMIWSTETINCLLSSLALRQTLRHSKASGS